MSEDFEEGYFTYDSDNDQWKMSFSFNTNSPEFTKGFTCGQIWNLMELNSPGFEFVTTADLLITIVEMADVRGYEITMEEIDKDAVSTTGLDPSTEWLHLSFTRKKVAA